EPFPTGQPGDTSVWWTWTAPVADGFTISTAGSDFDTILAVYTGTVVSNLTLVAANDDASSETVTSSLSLQTIAGQAYQIGVDGFLWSSGNIQLQISRGAATTVSITSPPDGAVFTAPASFQLAAQVHGTVTNVQFFQGSTSLGNVAVSPFMVSVNDLDVGDY